MGDSNSSQMFCVVMAGGKGTRFWPESTSKNPKQYLNLTSDKSLLSETLKRFDGLVPLEKRYIVTVKEQAELARKHSTNMIKDHGFIFEPSGRNTAPCILLSLAALKAQGAKDDDVVTIVPSDHVILNTEGFRQTIKEAAELAADKDFIVTIGIPPNFPHTGFGYIQKGEKLESANKVSQFKEKPDFDTAKSYLASGDYFWNAGMFLGKLGVLLEEFANHSPETFCHYESLIASIDNETELANAYNKIPKDSIDYAIMEKSSRVAVCAAQFDWNDLGSWDALESVLEPQDKNTIVKAKEVYLENSEGNIVYAPEKFVSLINIKDTIVISNEDSVVVLPKKDSQNVKNIVEYLKSSDKSSHLL
jgi:mannose-1-phosphate guanylyltransferase